MDTKTKYNPDLGREIQDSLRAQHTNTPHTPTPWKVQARQTNLIPLLPAIHNESGVRICTMNSIDVLTETENAAHIVRCVNQAEVRELFLLKLSRRACLDQQLNGKC